MSQEVDVIPHSGSKDLGHYFGSSFDFTGLVRDWIKEHSGRRIVSTTYLPQLDRREHGVTHFNTIPTTGAPHFFVFGGQGWLMIVHEAGGQ